MSNTEYRVELEVYNGPLDLLLYLIKKEEVDIYDIPIARITEQYMAYMERIGRLEPGLAGDFLLMAATLMHIKSQMLLPQPPEEEEEDPRWELVRQLLEYKRFKEAASALEALRQEREKRLPRAVRPLSEEGETLCLEESSPWELLGLYCRLLRETLLEVPTTLVLEETLVEEYMHQILDRLRFKEGFYFLELFVQEVDRQEVIGAFLALLELARLMKARVEQASESSDIKISRGNLYAAP